MKAPCWVDVPFFNKYNIPKDISHIDHKCLRAEICFVEPYYVRSAVFTAHHHTTLHHQAVRPQMDPSSKMIADWPDPPASVAKILVDDVTRMNSASVERIIMPRSSEDVQRALAEARRAGVHVSMRGTRHCMGGHTIAKDGYVIDMARLNKISFDPSKPDTVVTGPGALWYKLIVCIGTGIGVRPYLIVMPAHMSAHTCPCAQVRPNQAP